MDRTNRAGNYVYRARTVHRPTTLDQVREIVAAAPRIRVMGSGHSFTDIGDSEELLSLDGLPADVVIDHSARTVSLGAGLRYGTLAEALRAKGMALANLASLPHISVAGAIATATHGSGDGNRNLAGSVAALELVTSDGAIISSARGDAVFDGLVVGLGALVHVRPVRAGPADNAQARQATRQIIKRLTERCTSRTSLAVCRSCCGCRESLWYGDSDSRAWGHGGGSGGSAGGVDRVR